MVLDSFTVLSSNGNGDALDFLVNTLNKDAPNFPDFGFDLGTDPESEWLPSDGQSDLFPVSLWSHLSLVVTLDVPDVEVSLYFGTAPPMSSSSHGDNRGRIVLLDTLALSTAREPGLLLIGVLCGNCLDSDVTSVTLCVFMAVSHVESTWVIAGPAILEASSVSASTGSWTSISSAKPCRIQSSLPTDIKSSLFIFLSTTILSLSLSSQLIPAELPEWLDNVSRFGASSVVPVSSGSTTASVSVFAAGGSSVLGGTVATSSVCWLFCPLAATMTGRLSKVISLDTERGLVSEEEGDELNSPSSNDTKWTGFRFFFLLLFRSTGIRSHIQKGIYRNWALYDS